MTQLVLIMYLADMLDTITCAVGFVVFVTMCSTLVTITGYCLCAWSRYEELNTDEEYNRILGCPSGRRFALACKLKSKFFNRAFKISLAILLVATLVRTVLPRERTLYAFMGVEATQQVTKQIASDPRMEKIMKIIDAKLDAMVKETNKDGN